MFSVMYHRIPKSVNHLQAFVDSPGEPTRLWEQQLNVGIVKVFKCLNVGRTQSLAIQGI